MSAEEEFLRATEFAIGAIKLAVFRLDARLSRLEEAFLELHQMTVLPEIPVTAEEEAFLEKYRDLIDEEDP